MANPGKPAHVPTEKTKEMVREFYSAGVPQERIANHLEIDPTTLRRHYRTELDLTTDGMQTALMKNLYQDALNGDKQSREFWLKTRGKLSFAKAQDDDGKDDRTHSLLEKLIEKL